MCDGILSSLILLSRVTYAELLPDRYRSCVGSFLVLEFDPPRMFLSLRIGGFDVLSSGVLGDRVFQLYLRLEVGLIADTVDEIHHGGQGSSRPTLQVPPQEVQLSSQY